MLPLPELFSMPRAYAWEANTVAEQVETLQMLNPEVEKLSFAFFCCNLITT